MVRYEEITKVKIESLTRVDNADRIMEEIQGKETGFKGYRHDSSKLDKFRSAVSKSLGAIDKLSSILGPALSHVRQNLHLLPTTHTDVSIGFPS